MLFVICNPPKIKHLVSCTQRYFIYIDIDKILVALKAKNAGKVINVKLRFYILKLI